MTARARPSDLHAVCTWPSCPRASEIRVEYARSRELDSRLAWLPSADGGIVVLCEPHAEVFEDALGPGQILRLARLM
jgi:hypothetical protein